ncbi:hypothetical protein [Spirulina sp. 06S082]|nr:hypothetical protein [Spirulina sp. 06S082]MEA5468576.1 hypothetical protein [Spirulina sp. 06S082]
MTRKRSRLQFLPDLKKDKNRVTCLTIALQNFRAIADRIYK